MTTGANPFDVNPFDESDENPFAEVGLSEEGKDVLRFLLKVALADGARTQQESTAILQFLSERNETATQADLSAYEPVVEGTSVQAILESCGSYDVMWGESLVRLGMRLALVDGVVHSTERLVIQSAVAHFHITGERFKTLYQEARTASAFRG